MAAEVAKRQAGTGRRRDLFWFRDQQGTEVDFVVPSGHRRLLLIEAKASRTASPSMAGPLLRLARAIKGYEVESLVVHRPPRETAAITALAPGVRAVTIPGLLEQIR